MSYDPKFERPSITVDTIIFTIIDEGLKVLLINREKEPLGWALPGTFVGINESIDDAAKRGLENKTGVKNVYLEQLYTFGELQRDPRGRIITVSYLALINSKDLELKGKNDKEVKWFDPYKVKGLCFDHDKILKYAIQRLQWKLEYTTIAFQLLPKKFTLTQLQKTYEIIFRKQFDKRNFRKKIFSIGLVEPTKEYTKNVSHRPALLYKFTKKIGEIVEII